MSSVYFTVDGSTFSTHFEYDVLGRQYLAGERKVTYSHFNLPLSVEANGSRTEYWYDAFDRRSRAWDKDSGTTTHYGQSLFERQSGPGGVQWVFHVYSPTGQIAEVRELEGSSGRDIEYLHADHLGSPVVGTADGGLGSLRLYDPFGLPLEQDLSDTPSVRPRVTRGFTGHVQEAQADLIDMGGRFYDPRLRSFLTPDPIDANPTSSQGLNFYTYVENSPLVRTDPSGYDWENVGGSTTTSGDGRTTTTVDVDVWIDRAFDRGMANLDGHEGTHAGWQYGAGGVGGPGDPRSGVWPARASVERGVANRSGGGAGGLSGAGADGFGGPSSVRPVQRLFDPARDSGVQINGPRRDEFLGMLRDAMARDPAFAAHVLAQEGNVANPIRLRAFEQSGGVWIDAADSLRANPGPLGSHTVDVGDLRAFPEGPGPGPAHEIATRGEMIVHFVMEAIGEVQRGGSGVVSPQRAAVIFDQAHAGAIREQNAYRQALGQVGRAMADFNFAWRARPMTIRIPYQGAGTTIVHVSPRFQTLRVTMAAGGR